MKPTYYNLIEVDFESLKYIQGKGGTKFLHEDKTGMEHDYSPKWGWVREICEEETSLEEGDHVLCHHRAYKTMQKIGDKVYFTLPPNEPIVEIKGIIRKGEIKAYADVSICRPMRPQMEKNGILLHKHWKEEYLKQKSTVLYSNVYNRGDVLEYLIHADYEEKMVGQLYWFIKPENVVVVNGEIQEGWVHITPKAFDEYKKSESGLMIPYTEEEKANNKKFAFAHTGEHKGNEVVIVHAKKVNDKWYCHTDWIVAVV